MKKIVIWLVLLVCAVFADSQKYSELGKLGAYMPYGMALTTGQLSGHSTIDKYGECMALDADGSGDIWDDCTDMQYDADSTAPIKYLSSSNALDVGQTIQITGLDSLGYKVVQSVITNGQNVVTLPTPLWRAYRMENVSLLAAGNLQGTLYLHTEPTPTAGVPAAISRRAIIDNGNNQTLMAIMTIPRGYVGFLHRGEVGAGTVGGGASTAEIMIVSYYSRRYGKLFRVKKRLTVSFNGNSNYSDYRSFPDVIPSLTDIRLRAEFVSADCRPWGTFDIELIEESNFTSSYLKAIGQPGY